MDVFVTGSTGYIGRRLIAALVARGHAVRALVREGSAGRLPPRTTPVTGDALAAATFAQALRPTDTLVHLVGTPHPNPAKAAEFERVDLASIAASARAAATAGVRHVVYVSVAQPTSLMRAYVSVRARGEALLAAAGLTATILRPWYVIGPGHRWPLVLQPLYALAELFPATRERALRMGLVTIDSMVAALVAAVEAPPAKGERRIVEVPAIRATRLA